LRKTKKFHWYYWCICMIRWRIRDRSEYSITSIVHHYVGKKQCSIWNCYSAGYESCYISICVKRREFMGPF
jgi:hypothetical protein